MSLSIEGIPAGVYLLNFSGKDVSQSTRLLIIAR
jgi:hypothetical protein